MKMLNKNLFLNTTIRYHVFQTIIQQERSILFSDIRQQLMSDHTFLLQQIDFYDFNSCIYPNNHFSETETIPHRYPKNTEPTVSCL